MNNRKPMRRHRRGVLLLVVLSLLVLFLLAGLSFVIVAGQYRRGTIAVSKIERSETSPRKLMELAAIQILNPPDPSDPSALPNSALTGHGLLEDMYGRDGFVGQVSAVSPTTDISVKDFVTIQYTFASTTQPPNATYYNGCVMTMTSGRLAGQSSRIVDYNWSGSTITMTVAAFSGQRPLPGETFVVNGRAFNGTGSGYMPTTGNLDLQYDYTQDMLGDAELALLPRRATALADGNNDGDGLINLPDTAVFNGGSDEDYDAVDEQNMLLAQVVAAAGISTPPIPNGGELIIPSLHRPALLNYWHGRLLTAGVANGLMEPNPATISLLRDVCLRPNRFDHPQFTGSNRWLSAEVPNDVYLRRLIQGTEDADFDGLADDINGDGSPDQISTWDVDNDGDGLADSIWVDLGFPVNTTSDGRSFKPLFAILCVDLDGRVNLNTAGSWQDFTLDTSGQMDQLTAGAVFPTTSSGPFGPSPYGQGAGPAEINPFPVFVNINDHEFVLSQRYKSFAASDFLPGITARSDLADTLLLPSGFAWPRAGQVGSAFDVLGVDATAVDHAGRPVSTLVFGTYGQVTQVVDHPYEQNVVDPNGRDAMYSLADLEPMLRPYDEDISKDGSRLAPLDSFYSAPDALRRTRLVTTQSIDVPTPNVVVPKEMRASLGPNASLADIYYQRSFDGTSYAIDTTNKLAALLPFEIWHGEKMNINRWFGDGEDNDQNGVVDEPGEVNSMSVVELLNDDPILTGINPTLARYQSPVRQLFARHLYSLLMFLRNAGVPLVNDEDLTGLQSARVVAQWAVNVVDFCDPDSIMTPFEFDLRPYNGWDVDGILGSGSPDDNSPERGLVWGCERPELLITETLAWHDRRVEDRDDEQMNRNGGMPLFPAKTDDPTNPDNDLDQFAMPVGTLFVELYNPNLGNGYIQQPLELYDSTGSALQLNRLATDGAATSPVWRLVIAEGGANGYYPDPDAEPIPSDAEKRFVYFVNDATYSSITPKAAGNKEKDFFASNTAHPTNFDVLVEPGQYLVVGSQGTPVPDASTIRYVSNVGFVKNTSNTNVFALPPNTPDPADFMYTNMRRVELTPRATSEYEVRIETNGSDGVTPAPQYDNFPSEFKRNVAFVVGRSRFGDAGTVSPESLNVSIPIGGYRELAGPNAIAGLGIKDYGKVLDSSGVFENEQVLSSVLDFQLDFNRSGPNPEDGGTDRFGLNGKNGTKPQWQAVYLQRLANPLLPYNAITNPYLTIDKATIDLIVFNGLESQFSAPSPPAVPFYAKQRGDRSFQMDNSIRRNIFSMEPPDSTMYQNSAPDISGSIGEHYFDFVLHSTLGCLNDGYRPYFATPPSPAYLGAPDTLNGNPQTFPWLAWNNRPFANVLELMNVPRTSPATMLEYFGIQPLAPTDEIIRMPHGNLYLMPFLAAKNGSGVSSISMDDPGLCRLFDYVEVPSRFMGTSKWLDLNVNDPEKPAGFLAPNNRLRMWRDPGKVNLNTVTDVAVWKALGASFGLTEIQLETLWLEVESSMRGNIINNLTLDIQKPSAIPHPIRSAGASDLSPLSAERVVKGRDGSMLRLQDIIDENSVNLSYRDKTRNPQFHYQELQKLSSMVTTHSNVYAVWVTLGYFEVKPWYDNDQDGVLDANPSPQPTKDAAHPDGYMLADELGLNTGQITRHRAFYIMDRSIPVAYEPGKEHNAKNAIVLQRFIE